jgi:hypothetical protein
LLFVRRNAGSRIGYEFRLKSLFRYDRRVIRTYWRSGRGFFWTFVCGHFYVVMPTGTELHFSSTGDRNKFIKPGRICRSRPMQMDHPTSDLTGIPI